MTEAMAVRLAAIQVVAAQVALLHTRSQTLALMISLPIRQS